MHLDGSQCQDVHPSKSPVIDAEDSSYVEYGVFMQDELNGILALNVKKVPLPPWHVVEHMKQYHRRYS